MDEKRKMILQERSKILLSKKIELENKMYALLINAINGCGGMRKFCAVYHYTPGYISKVINDQKFSALCGILKTIETGKRK